MHPWLQDSSLRQASSLEHVQSEQLHLEPKVYQRYFRLNLLPISLWFLLCLSLHGSKCLRSSSPHDSSLRLLWIFLPFPESQRQE